MAKGPTDFFSYSFTQRLVCINFLSLSKSISRLLQLATGMKSFKNDVCMISVSVKLSLHANATLSKDASHWGRLDLKHPCFVSRSRALFHLSPLISCHLTTYMYLIKAQNVQKNEKDN